MGSTTPDPSNTNTPDPITLDKHLKPWQKASADVVLVAGGGTKFLCNAAVLASHSRVFESCIYGEDATKATPENPVVFEKAIAGKTLRELELLVGYLYAASPPVYVAKVRVCGFYARISADVCIHPPSPLQLPINSVLLLADMADEYHMDSLLQQCRVAVEGYVENTQVLKAHRGHDGVLKWTLIAQRFGFAKLLADCEYIIIRYGCAVGGCCCARCLCNTIPTLASVTIMTWKKIHACTSWVQARGSGLRVAWHLQ